MSNTKKLIIAGLLLAMGLILPQIFHLFSSEASKIFSPMHLPTFFAGFLLGPFYGLLVGVCTPLLSSLINGMPQLIPVGISMMVEIGLYGFICGISSKKAPLWICLFAAIVLGRVGYVTLLCLIQNISSLTAWFTMIVANFTSGFFAIVLQFSIIPLLVPKIQQALNNSNH